MLPYLKYGVTYIIAQAALREIAYLASYDQSFREVPAIVTTRVQQILDDGFCILPTLHDDKFAASLISMAIMTALLLETPQVLLSYKQFTTLHKPNDMRLLHDSLTQHMQFTMGSSTLDLSETRPALHEVMQQLNTSFGTFTAIA